MQKLIIIKLGGSVITDKTKSLTARRSTILRLGREIVEGQKKYPGKIIITHGSGSFGHPVAKKYKTHLGLINSNSLLGMVRTSEAAIKINRIVMENLLKSGLLARSFSPASMITAKNFNLNSCCIKPIELALDLNTVPVMYGDVVMDTEKGFCIFSAEKVIATIAKSLSKNYRIDKIIYCTDTDGVYDEKGKTISKISQKNFSTIKQAISGSKSNDVTGGMFHKVIESLKFSERYRTEVFLINGNKQNELREVILKNNYERGTLIAG
jgi:isopentenyl phosphate kinase